MLSKKMQDAFNEQIKWEFYSAYLYLSMASYFESIDLPGFSNWMRIQFQEEQFHAMKFFDYVIERGGTVELQAIDAPPTQWKDSLDVFTFTLAHEEEVTKKINDLVYLARDQRDNASEIFLQWFVEEQVEEEDSVRTLIGQLKLIKNSPETLFLLDKDLAQRTFTPPATEG